VKFKLPIVHVRATAMPQERINISARYQQDAALDILRRHQKSTQRQE
jgi:hypothetical protein